MARWIQESVEAGYGLGCTVGIGPNKLLAKLAAKLHKPKGIGRIHLEEVPTCLTDLPVESVSGIGPELTKALRGMGVRSLGELAQVPVGILTHRFGCYGECLHRMSLGIDDSPVLPMDSPEVIKSMGHAYTLERDTMDPLLLKGVLLRLAEKVGRRLRRAGYSGRTVCLTVRFKDFTTLTRQRTLGEFLNDGLLIYREAWRLFQERVPWGCPEGAGRSALSSRTLGRPVRLLGVAVSNLARVTDRPDLWEDRPRRQRLIAAMDRVNDSFGEETIHRALGMAPLVQKTRGYFGHRWLPA